MRRAQSDRTEGRLAQNTPRSRGSLSHGHLVWPKVLLCAMALLFGATTGHSQWLETKVILPDSLGGAIWPSCLTTDTSERYVYIGDKGSWGQGGGIYVVDAEARSRVARIPAGLVSSVCTNTRRNKVYAADSAGSQVFVISCSTNQVVATIATDAKPAALCYNSINDKVYSADYNGGDLTVIDCSSDGVIKTIHLAKNPASLCYNPTSNRVFCVSETLWGGVLTVIDGASDSVVAVYPGSWQGTLTPVVNAVANRVYMSASVGTVVLDGATGVVLDTLEGDVSVMCLNPRTQKLYVGETRTVSVFDCVADTLITWLPYLRLDDLSSIACDTLTNRVYAAGKWQSWAMLLVIDGNADTVSALMSGPHEGKLLASSKRGRMYCTDSYGPALAVFDTGTDSLLHNIFIGGDSRRMCYDATDDKVYYASYSFRGEVGAINAATNKPVAHIQVGSYPQSIVWHAPTNRVYCGGGSDITVIDAAADTVTKVLPVAGFELCSAPRVNKIYAFDGNNTLNVIDCGSDSVIKAVPLPYPENTVFTMCYVAYDKLYVSAYYSIFVIDCIKDSLIRSYNVGYNRVAAGREGKRVHCATTDSLCTFDPAGDTVVAHVPWRSYGLFEVTYASGVDKVYCVDAEGSIMIGDGATDSLVAEIPLEDAWAIGYDVASNLVCCGQAFDSTITFVDSRTDRVVGGENLGFRPQTFVPVPVHRRVYVGGESGSFIAVIRTDPPGVDEVTSPCTKNAVRPTVLSRRSPLVVHQPCDLLDAAGRKVLDARPGLHGLSGYRTGVYFLRNRADKKTVKILLVD